MRRTTSGGVSTVYYLLQDHLKSSSAIASQTGVVAAADRNYYLPFGGKRGTNPFSTLTTKRFTGQYHESTLPGGEGLSYYGSRWYDAKLGRFLSADTIVPGAGNPQAFNRYSYVFNRPLVMIDPTGHAGIPYLTPGNGGGSGQRPSSAPVVTCAGNGCYRPSSGSVVTCANNGCGSPAPSSGIVLTGAGGGTGQFANVSTGVVSQYSFPSYTPLVQPVSWKQPYRDAIPVAKYLTKNYWGCLIGQCNISTQNWTASVDLGAFLAPVGVTGRISGSIVFDHQGGIGLMGTLGTGGSTPTQNIGLGGTITNAPSIDKLNGGSVQIGGSISEGVGIFAEGVFFKDSETSQQYLGLSVSGVGSFPDLIPGSIHGTYEQSWVQGTNLVDAFFAPLEWLLSD